MGMRLDLNSRPIAVQNVRLKKNRSFAVNRWRLRAGGCLCCGWGLPHFAGGFFCIIFEL